MNELIEFLIEKSARVSFGDMWLIAERQGEDVTYTVYQKSYGKKKTSIVYEGSYLSTAVKFLSGEIA
jgi:hypothetical protein